MNNDESSKSRRIEPITIRSVLALDEEPSLSSLGRGDLRSASAVSSSRERLVASDRSSGRYGPLLSTDGGHIRHGEESDTLPSVRPTVMFAQGTLVAKRYEIRRFLGRGGMGQVYEAYDRILR